MEPEDVPDPQELWWSAVVLAALQRAASGTPRCRLDTRTQVVELDRADGAWLRLQRCRGGRYVLWGRSDLAPTAPRDARRDAPDWTRSPATDGERPTFVAWFAHGEWDVTDEADLGAPQLLRPWLSVDPRLVALAGDGVLGADDLAAHVTTPAEEPVPGGASPLEAAVDLVRQASAPPPSLTWGSVRTRLRDQVHDQMREAPEADRQLPQQPPELVRWGQVHAPRGPFEHAVMLRRGEMVPAVTNTALPRAARRTLATVLAELHHQESDDDHGAWLFARVSSDGEVVRFDRAFDHWPTWWRVAHPTQGPGVDDLAWEMAQREHTWQPDWAALLPVQV